jgi:hypothetical protein
VSAVPSFLSLSLSLACSSSGSLIVEIPRGLICACVDRHLPTHLPKVHRRLHHRLVEVFDWRGQGIEDKTCDDRHVTTHAPRPICRCPGLTLVACRFVLPGSAVSMVVCCQTPWRNHLLKIHLKKVTCRLSLTFSAYIRLGGRRR